MLPTRQGGRVGVPAGGLSSAQLRRLWNTIVCSASTDGTVRAWNIQNVSAAPYVYLLNSK